MKRNHNRRTDSQMKREEEFRSSLDQLFDVFHYRRQQMVKIQEDREFLEDQKSGRSLKMGEIHKECVSKRKRKVERENAVQERRKKEMLRRESQKALEQLVHDTASESSNDPSETDDDIGDDTEFEAKKKEKEEADIERGKDCVTVKLPKRILNAEHVCVSADCHGLSKRQLFETVAAIIKTSNADVDDFVL